MTLLCNTDSGHGTTLRYPLCADPSCATCQHRIREDAPRPDEGRSDYLGRAYGMHVEDYEELCSEQNYACAICREETEYPLHVDHCHTRGHVRGLLCRRCNQGLGFFRDSEDLLLAAERYLRLDRLRRGERRKKTHLQRGPEPWRDGR